MIDLSVQLDYNERKYEKRGNIMLLQELKNRNLPELKSQEEMIDILQSEIYGKKLPDPENIEFIKEAEPLVPRFCANKASIYKVIAKCTLNGKEFSFPFYEVFWLFYKIG